MPYMIKAQTTEEIASCAEFVAEVDANSSIFSRLALPLSLNHRGD